MNLERLLSSLEKIYGKRPVERNSFNRREALPKEIKEKLDEAKSNGNKAPEDSQD